MPDTIVPIVRRPVRRPSTDAVAVKPSDVTSEIRKLSIGGESNSTSATVTDSPLRYRKTISSLNKERERAEAASKVTPTSSVTTSRKSSLFDDSELEKIPPPYNPTPYEVPANTSGFPHAPKENLPKLHETRNKAKKTPVSFYLIFLIIELL